MAEVIDLMDASDEELALLPNSTRQQQRKRRRKRKIPYEIAVAKKHQRCIDVDDNDDDDIVVVATRAASTPARPTIEKLSPLQQILEVIPDVATIHANKLLKELGNNVSMVVETLLQSSTYPKDTNTAGSSAANAGGLFIRRTKAEPTYDFMSLSSFEPTQVYQEQALSRLVFDFPFLSRSGARALLKKVNNHYAIAHSKIVSAITGSEETKGKAFTNRGSGEDTDIEVIQYRRYKAVTVRQNNIDATVKTRLSNLFGIANFGRLHKYFTVTPKSTRKRICTNFTDTILLEELGVVQEKLCEWTNAVDMSIQRFHARKMAVAEGSALECPCCCNEVATDELVACREADLFCLDCVANYARNKIFDLMSFGNHPKTKAPYLELTCFHSGCSAGFDRSMLQKALKPKELERYDELQSKLSLEQAGLGENTCTCPKCGYSAELPSGQNVFSCPMEGCRFESCRMCREASHVPLRCDEVEKKSEQEGRARVEEAASNAIIRPCPQCKKPIIKEEGCNKMTCPSCKNVKFCYMCRQKVTSYKHFCQTPHCNHKKCNMCPLWTTDLAAIHAKEVRDAAMAEAARVEAEGAKATEMEDSKKTALFASNDEDRKPAAVAPRIDVDAILQAPKPGRAR